MDAHGVSAADEQHVRETALDETLANTFPASDPLSSIPNPAQRDEIVAAVANAEDERQTPFREEIARLFAEYTANLRNVLALARSRDAANGHRRPADHRAGRAQTRSEREDADAPE